MRLIILFILFAGYKQGNCQFAIIQDDDGYVHVRSNTNKDDNITDTLYNGSIVWCFDAKKKWYPVSYDSDSIRGYIKKSTKFLSSYPSIPVYLKNMNSYNFKKGLIKISVSKSPFLTKKNKLKYIKTNGQNYLTQINGKEFWGTDGKQPKTQYEKISVVIDGKMINLPKEALENLYQPSLANTTVNHDLKSDKLYITAINGDGAGGYAVLWIIEKGKYQKRIVTRPF